MRCIEEHGRRSAAATCLWAGFSVILLLAGCAADRPPAAPTGTAPAAAAATPAAAAAAIASGASTGAAVSPPRYPKLPPPMPVQSASELKLQAAQRLLDAHPDTSYRGRPPEPLLAIPVLEVELNADGSVRAIKVLREPRQAKDTIQLAIDAVRRAAPFGDVSRLHKPWVFVEVFLFDDERRFKPATLDR